MARHCGFSYRGIAMKTIMKFISLGLLLAVPPLGDARAQTTSAIVVAACGGVSYSAGQNRQVTQDPTGKLCGSDASTINPGARTIVPLDISTVTTGGTAVTALTAGHRTAGGFLYNPIGATINLCINEQGTASGTTSAGALTCVQPGQTYTLTPASTAVSVITSDSSHQFSGQGLN